jgi:hypothetical protein
VNGEFYKEVIKKSIALDRRVRPVSGKQVLVSSARHSAFFGRCLRVFGETRDPRVNPSILLP